MTRPIALLMFAAATPVAAAQLLITPIDAFARGGGNGFIDSFDTGLSEFFANDDEAVETMTMSGGGQTTLGVNAGTGTSGGILDLIGAASGFAGIELAIPDGSARLADGDTATITAMASASSSFRASNIGEFEGGFVNINGFATATIAFDTLEPLIATAFGDFLNVPGMPAVMLLAPGCHIFDFGINAPLGLEGAEVTSGVDVEVTNSFDGQIVLTRVPAPATAVVFGAAAFLRRRR